MQAQHFPFLSGTSFANILRKIFYDQSQKTFMSNQLNEKPGPGSSVVEFTS